MTDAEISAYLINAYTKGVAAAVHEYRFHKTSRSHTPNCPCRRVEVQQRASKETDK